MPLTLLTPELKLCITDHLDPVSTLNFALTCKEHWKLNQNLLQHHTRRFAEAPLLASYEVLGPPNRHIDGPPRTRIGIWQTLEDVLRDPRKGWYITEIDLRSGWVDLNRKAPEDVPPEFLEAAIELMDLYPPLFDDDWRLTTPLRLHELLDPAEKCIVTQIYDDVKSGSPAGVLAILVHHLPNLRTLRMTMDNDDMTFGVMIDWVAIEYMDAAKALRLPFQRLKTVALSHYDTEGCIAADWALIFLHLPSLRTFAASMMGGDFRRRKMDIAKARSAQPPSGVEEFIFSSCQFEAKALGYMIARTRALKRFTYTAGGPCTDEALYDPKVVLNALSKYAGDSLEHLVLQHFDLCEEERLFRDAPRWDDHNECDSDDDSSGLEDESKPPRPIRVKLTGLTKLRSLYAHWAMLWPEVYHDAPVPGNNEWSPNLERYRHPFDIRTILPPSLEWLSLHGGFQESEWANLVEPLATPGTHNTPLLDMDQIRIAGRVHSEQRQRQPWLPGEKRVFGNAEQAWFKGYAPQFNLFAGQGW